MSASDRLLEVSKRAKAAKAAGKKLPKSKKAKPDYRKLQALDLSAVTGIIK